MLAGTPEYIDMLQMKNELSTHVPDEFKQYVLDDNTVTEISYPVLEIS